MLKTDSLNAEVYQFLLKNLNTPPSAIALAKSPFTGISAAFLATQLNGMQKAKTKLPLWFSNPLVLYPPALSLQQCSSQVAALNKAHLVYGKTLADLTSGFGVDSAAFSLTGCMVNAFEIQPQLAALNAHNAQCLNLKNYNLQACDGLEYVLTQGRHFDTIYLDPARRVGSSRVINLAEYTPNILPHLQSLLKLTPNLIIKTSPMLDVAAGIKALQYVKHLQAVSYKNDCKELLWVLAPGGGQVTYSASLLTNNSRTIYTLAPAGIPAPSLSPSVTAGNFVYDADVAVTKLNGQNYFAHKIGLLTLSAKSHLYTSPGQVSGFPGRCYLVNQVIPAKLFMRMGNQTGNILVRGFPGSPTALSAKYSKGALPHQYLIFTHHHSLGNIVLQATLV